MYKIDAIDYINNIPKFANHNSMDHTRRFMELLGNPDKKMKIIHVAGTNGKGSTCAYINEILCAMGKKVGLFTSPHLQCMTERIRMNNQRIDKEELQIVFDETMEAVVQLQKEGIPHPVFSEFLFGMSMKAFVRQEMEYAILETGLGGRCDATNVVDHPIVTVITNIGLDHMECLGDTLEKIALEKAGILKFGVPVVFDGSISVVNDIIEKQALKKGCPCRIISEDAYEIEEIEEKAIAFSIKDAYDKHVTWRINNRGRYQVMNAAVALGALEEIIKSEGISMNYDLWKEALLGTYWPGRMEEVQPNVYADGGHNVPAITAVVRDENVYDVVLYAAVQEKNYQEMIRILCEQMKAKAYIVTSIQNSRSMNAEQLGQVFRSYTNAPVYVEGDVRQAFNKGLALKGKEEKMLCIGSLYLVGEIKDLMQDYENTGGIQNA